MLTTPFRKIHGAGNDFVLLTEPPPRDWRTEAPRLCARRTGVGADGLVLSTLVDKDPIPVLDVTCINADGSIASMGGNALRCAAWAAAIDYGFTTMALVMAGACHEGVVSESRVSVTAQARPVEPDRVHVDAFTFDAVHTGTEHVVALVEDVDAVDVEEIGPKVRHHRALAPIGTNVNFVQVIDPYTLRIRTFERGVEAETLSCGSGAVAAVVVAAYHHAVFDRPVTVHNSSGRPLIVAKQRKQSYWVGGPVDLVFFGELELS
jgi:diaminopimelate epimerase